jgi:hypothetical protein
MAAVVVRVVWVGQPRVSLEIMSVPLARLEVVIAIAFTIFWLALVEPVALAAQAVPEVTVAMVAMRPMFRARLGVQVEMVVAAALVVMAIMAAVRWDLALVRLRPALYLPLTMIYIPFRVATADPVAWQAAAV